MQDRLSSVISSQNFLGFSVNIKLCRVEAVFGKSLDVNLEGALIIYEHVEAFVALQGKMIQIVEHHSSVGVRFLVLESMSVPLSLTVVGIIVAEKISLRICSLGRHLFFAPL